MEVCAFSGGISPLVAAGRLPAAAQPGGNLAQAACLAAGEAAVSGVSPLARFSLAYGLSEVSLSASQAQYGYTRQGGGAALRVSRSLSVKTSQETLHVALAFSAEALGLSSADFSAAGGEPIRLRFKFRQEQARLDYSSQTQVLKTVRKPEEILSELADALGKVFRQRGGKSIGVILDEEAAQALLCDEKAREAFAMLIALMNLIEMQSQEGELKRYLIRLSGKGKPMIDHAERLEVEAHSLAVDVELTIYPPQAEKAALNGDAHVKGEQEQGRWL